jgi:hypothetical protein
MLSKAAMRSIPTLASLASLYSSNAHCVPKSVPSISAIVDSLEQSIVAKLEPLSSTHSSQGSTSAVLVGGIKRLLPDIATGWHQAGVVMAVNAWRFQRNFHLEMQSRNHWLSSLPCRICILNSLSSGAFSLARSRSPRSLRFRSRYPSRPSVGWSLTDPRI